MIRSLVITPNSEPLADGAAETAAILRRNLTQEGLEKCLNEGAAMWIDIVTPDDEEIHWLEGLLDLTSTVVADLLREDRRPTLVVYPRYLFLSLFSRIHKAMECGKKNHWHIGDISV